MNQRPLGKVRNPLTCILLTIITLGIYGVIWGFGVFQDLRDYRGKGWSGGLFLLFTLVPVVNLASIAVPWLLPSYIGNLYAEDGRSRPISGLHGCWIFLPVVGHIIWFFSVNSHLNQFWISKKEAAHAVLVEQEGATDPSPAGI